MNDTSKSDKSRKSVPSGTDRIEKSIHLRAPLARVWRALTDAAEFGKWFRVKLEGAFAIGQTIRGKLTFPGYEYLTMEATVVRMDPERLFSFRWHPAAIDPKVDYAQEPTTLVEFWLEEAPGGTLLRVVESGFDKLPASRRGEAFRMNSEGWDEQLESLLRHVAR
jgi:uncharacterized protein YndB with AHSA1/START domain